MVDRQQDSYFLSMPGGTTKWDTIFHAQKGFSGASGIALGFWLLLASVLCLLLPLTSTTIRLRKLISTIDLFHLNHWIEERKCQVKKKTELGGVFSIAMSIFVVGIGSGLVHDYVGWSRVQLQVVVPMIGRERFDFRTDVTIDIAVQSNMTCRQLSQLPASAMSSSSNGSFQVACRDSPSLGPLLQLSCSGCVYTEDSYLFSFGFSDVPGSPATALGFQVSIDARSSPQGRPELHNHATAHIEPPQTIESLPGGSSGSSVLRGLQPSVASLHLSPRRFRYRADIRSLMECTLVSFSAGSHFPPNSNALNSSLERSEGLQLDVHISVESTFIIETRAEGINGPLTLLARVGGVAGASIATFLFLLIVLEWLVPTFWKSQDAKLKRSSARLRAAERWEKIRLYVKYIGVHSHAEKGRFSLSVLHHAEACRQGSKGAPAVAAEKGGAAIDPFWGRDSAKKHPRRSLQSHIKRKAPVNKRMAVALLRRTIQKHDDLCGSAVDEKALSSIFRWRSKTVAQGQVVEMVNRPAGKARLDGRDTELASTGHDRAPAEGIIPASPSPRREETHASHDRWQEMVEIHERLKESHLWHLTLLWELSKGEALLEKVKNRLQGNTHTVMLRSK